MPGKRAMFADMRTLMKWALDRVGILIDKYIAKRRRKQLAVAVVKLTAKERNELAEGYGKFMDHLKPNQRILLGSFDACYMLEMVAFTEALNFDYIQKDFKRNEIEALQYYYFRGEEKTAINKRFLLSVDDLIKKFKDRCKELDKV